MLIKRSVFSPILASCKGPEILLLVGPRQAGKTTLLRQVQNELQSQGETVFFLNLEDPEYLSLLNRNPKNLFTLFPLNLQKRTSLLIDEIQYLENPSRFLKYFFDEYQDKIKIIASGSSAFYIDQKFKDSLAGRKKVFTIYTLSFRDFIRFKGDEDLSVKDLKHLSLTEEEKIRHYYHEYVIYGGYPKVVLSPAEEKKDVLRELVFSYIKKDVFESGVRQEEVFYKLFRVLAGQAGQLVNATELASVLQVSKTAIDHYLYVMQRSFHLRLVRPFSKNIRKELTRMPKVYFLDPGLRNFLVNNFEFLEIRQDRGGVLENAVYRQLLESNDQEDIHFWRTVQNHEVDFVVGEKTAYEVKMSSSLFREKKYEPFLTAYPKIDFQIVALNHDAGRIRFPVMKPWEL